MGDIPPSPSSFKNALSFFNSLDRSATSPLIPRKTASNFEVNLKLVIDSKTVANSAYNIQQGDVQKFIPRARLIRRQDDVDRNIVRNIPAQDYLRPVSRQAGANPVEGSSPIPLVPPSVHPRVPPIVPPRVPPRPTSLTLSRARGGVTNFSLVSIDPTPLLDGYGNPRDQVTPDVEAKQILEAFTKEITPYNTFEIPVGALDSEFFRQTLTLANSEVDLSAIDAPRWTSNSKRSSRSSYRLPEGSERMFISSKIETLCPRLCPK